MVKQKSLIWDLSELPLLLFCQLYIYPFLSACNQHLLLSVNYASHCCTAHVTATSILFILTRLDRKTILFQKEVQPIADLCGRWLKVLWLSGQHQSLDDIVHFQWQIVQSMILIRGSQQTIWYDSQPFTYNRHFKLSQMRHHSLHTTNHLFCLLNQRSISSATINAHNLTEF